MDELYRPTCTACTLAIDPTSEHLTVTRQVERLTPDDEIAVSNAWVVAQFHEACAPANVEVSSA